MKTNKIINSYVSFVERREKNPGEKIIWLFLKILSFIYGACVGLRNFLYDKKIIPLYYAGAKVISIGNISWAGSGKTSLTWYLFNKLSAEYKPAVLRRGFGRDETTMLKDAGVEVFCAPNRCQLCRQLSSKYNLFILDDGFQYRGLHRDVDILVMGAREFKARGDLIPASFFREPFSSARRADFIIISYKNELEDKKKNMDRIKNTFDGPKLFFSSYRIEQFNDFEGKAVDKTYICSLKIAAVSAIGYPEGFFEALRQSGLAPEEYLTYPDHYEFSENEFIALQAKLLDEGFKGIIITGKDKYHIPPEAIRMKIFIARARLVIENEENFLEKLKTRLKETDA
ncbi:MAG: tetraacyldisaccharide 4'-kinase [Candidatus Omnitrophica bacterium]|nr:tetraacyldisaccharide 4'-kinase [Candidatus Omnitrophota bacterium]MBD3269833.1 tetraacyldisaccharide 4'-kinase [Candidatus Omnitrophota bacterium]